MQNYYIIIFPALFCVILCICWIIIRVKKSQGPTVGQISNSQIEKSQKMEILFDVISNLTETEEAQLSEIKNNKLLSVIDRVIPEAIKTVTDGATAKAFHDFSKNAGELYQVIIPKGAVLDKSKAIEGTFRGSYREVANQIKGNASWRPVDGSPAETMAMASAANAVMNVASMVVGQYYMAQINDQLGEINSGIEKIVDFQQNEYKSKVIALVAEIQKSSLFQVETIENYELRNRELAHIKSLEHECAQLLGQANLSLQTISEKRHQDYEDYEKNIRQAEIWIQYQQVLLELMKKISDLTYTLNLGAVSRENSLALCQPYIKQSDNTLDKMKEWHQHNCAKFEINIEESRRKRQGVEGFFMGALGWFDDDFNYKKMSKRTVDSIEHQSEKGSKDAPALEDDLFREDVRLIAKGGKIYYLPCRLSETTQG